MLFFEFPEDAQNAGSTDEALQTDGLVQIQCRTRGLNRSARRKKMLEDQVLCGTGPKRRARSGLNVGARGFNHPAIRHT